MELDNTLDNTKERQIRKNWYYDFLTNLSAKAAGFEDTEFRDIAEEFRFAEATIPRLIKPNGELNTGMATDEEVKKTYKVVRKETQRLLQNSDPTDESEGSQSQDKLILQGTKILNLLYNNWSTELRRNVFNELPE